MNTTDKLRKIARYSFAVIIAAALVGWFLDRDPNQLLGLLGAVTAVLGIGEASNVGKRVSFNKDAK